jgi:SAM-dependent MidA family methyltransferase
VDAEFSPATENAALKRAIVERIEAEGPIPFRDFMEMALYYPGLGYYTSRREKIGREGDYLTSPEVSPYFGALIGRQLREMWQAMGNPRRFDVTECGAGTGTLAADVLSWAGRSEPEFAEVLRYVIVEASAPLRERQRSRLAECATAEEVRWAEAIPADTQGCILSNELLDALPVHRVRMEDGELLEVLVWWTGAEFAETTRPASPVLTGYFHDLGLQPGEWCTVEVNLAALDWVRSAAAALGRGFLMTFDYGYEAQELYASWRTDGTLLCFYRHNPSNDPYARIGRQDMTAHVDFTSVMRAGEDAGLTTVGVVSQAEFLSNLGIGDALQAQEGGNLEEQFARRRAVMELIDPGGLGRVRALIQAKGAGGVDLTGISGHGRSIV